MGFIGIAAVAIAAAYFLTLGKTAAAASSLMYDLTKVQIHKIDGSGIKVRLYINFTNTKSTKVIVQMISLGIFIDSAKLALVQATNIEIPANSFSNKTIDVDISWSKLLLGIGQKALDWWQKGTLAAPTKCRVEGQVKAENITIPINKTIPFNSTPQV
ncbi:MAG: hypothetical protein MJZ03_06090 [archaeon]|nr:hypothetical protein [archaeon]